MKALIVLAHPESVSFNAALARSAQETLLAQGHDVRVSDLYARGFAADEHGRHFARRRNPQRFDAMTEQRFGAEQGVLPGDVQREIDDVMWADLIVLQFPLWWFSMPAILKGWMDRVFVYGQLYSSRRRLTAGVLSGKRAMLSVTAGSSAEACSYDGQEGDTTLILWPIHYTLHYVGLTVLEPALIFGVRGGLTGDDAAAQESHLDEQLRNHRVLFGSLDARAVISFNAAQDWDEHRKLEPHAAVHSPFIRHHADWKTVATADCATVR